MAPKRPLTDPPPASSSASSSSSSSSSEDEDISADNEEREQHQPHRTESKPKPSIEKPTQSQSSSESDPDEGSDSDSPTASAFTIKPIAPKPTDDPKTAEPKPKKRRKVSSGDENGANSEQQKRSGVNRLWSDDDEIAILEGIIDFRDKEKSDPFANMGEFHEFLKKSLRIDVSKSQLMSKIKRLKKKYRVNAAKCESGDDNVALSKPHDHKCFELSEKIWGGNKASVENGKSKKRSRAKKGKEADHEIAVAEASEELKGEVKTSSGEDFWSLYPGIEKDFSMVMPSSLGNVLRENMGLIGNSKAKELENKWKSLRMNEIELYQKRVKLIQEHTELVLAAMKASNK